MNRELDSVITIALGIIVVVVALLALILLVGVVYMLGYLLFTAGPEALITCGN